MRMFRRRFVIGLLLPLIISIVVYAFAYLVAVGFSTRMQGSPGGVPAGGIGLALPPFVQAAAGAALHQPEVQMLVEEAGLTAYANLNREIDLAAMTPGPGFTIRHQTDAYLSAIAYPPGYADLSELEEHREVQVLVRRDGWIVAYLFRAQPAAAAFDWANYDEKRLTTTLLEGIIRQLAADVGVSDYVVSYYDFRFPDAASLALAATWVEAPATTAKRFTVEAPRDLTIYEASWSHAAFGLSSRQRYPECYYDNRSISELRVENGLWLVANGLLADLSYGSAHTLGLLPGDHKTYCGVAIVYGPAAQ